MNNEWNLVLKRVRFSQSQLRDSAAHPACVADADSEHPAAAVRVAVVEKERIESAAAAGSVLASAYAGSRRSYEDEEVRDSWVANLPRAPAIETTSSPTSEHGPETSHFGTSPSHVAAFPCLCYCSSHGSAAAPVRSTPCSQYASRADAALVMIMSRRALDTEFVIKKVYRAVPVDFPVDAVAVVAVLAVDVADRNAWRKPEHEQHPEPHANQ